MASYADLPAGAEKTAIAPLDLRSKIPESKITDFETLIKLSTLGPETWENSHQEERGVFGVTQQWLAEAKRVWTEDFSWREQEKYIEMFPQWIAKIVDDDGEEYDVHFTALFSRKEDAVPLAFYHGWPGSFLEFYGVLQVLANRYTPETLPYHCVIPSLTGYAFSTGPPLDRDWSVQDTARLMHKLLLTLGFGSSGYIAQGGDIGSAVARILAASNPECKAAHLNFNLQPKPADVPDSAIRPSELRGLARAQHWERTGTAYVLTHGTRPSTIGLALSASPLALLAWLGEKFLEWSDADPPLADILRAAALYWLTDTFPRSIYPYRAYAQRMIGARAGAQPQAQPRVDKPFGFSAFPMEIVPAPKAWLEAAGNLQWFRAHDKGGHFAAWERPDEFAQDIEDFVAAVWER